MTTLRTQPAEQLADQVEPGWDGIWTLAVAAGRATVNLTLAVPVKDATTLASAAMDFREAQAEVEWARPDLPGRRVAVDVGCKRLAGGGAQARLIIEQLAAAALERAADLDATELTASEVMSLRWVVHSLRAARGKVTGRVPGVDR